jgi:hypothetical protein
MTYDRWGLAASTVRPGRVAVVREDMPEAFDRLCGLVGAVRLVDERPDGARLAWLGTERQPGSQPMQDLLTEFLELSSAPAETIADFARRFGPLLGTWDRRGRTHDDQRVDPPPAHRAATELSEPVDMWRTHARALGALLDAAAELREKGWLATKHWPGALSSLAVPAWAQVGARGAGGPAEVDLDMIAFDAITSYGFPIQPRSDGDRIADVLSGLLHISGVQPAFGSLAKGQPGACYAIPVEDFHPEGSDPFGGTRFVGGLLPVLAAQVAFACRKTVQVRCSWCGEIIRPSHFREKGKRHPRKGQPFYGSHDDCRKKARHETKVKSENKRRGLVQDDAVDSRVDSQTGG